MDSPSLHDTVAAPPADVAAAQPRSSSRRRLFGAGLGVVAALSPAFAGAAAAGPGDSSPDTGGEGGGGAPAPTSTAPKRPTDADLELLRFAQTVELAARDLYDAALASDQLDETARSVFTEIREAHEAYAQSLAGVIGTTAPGKPDAALARDLLRDFESGSTASVAGAAADLEDVLAATHRFLLGELEGTDAAALVASIVPIEGRHATVLSSLAGRSGLDDLIQNDAEPLQPEG